MGHGRHEMDSTQTAIEDARMARRAALNNELDKMSPGDFLWADIPLVLKSLHLLAGDLSPAELEKLEERVAIIKVNREGGIRFQQWLNARKRRGF